MTNLYHSPAVTYIRITEMFNRDPATWTRKRARPSKREVVKAAFDPTLTIAQIAAQANVHYFTARQYLSEANLTAARQKPDPSCYDSRRRVNPVAIIEAARTAPNLTAVAEQFGISLERVRQLVNKHEHQTGAHIARSARDYTKHPLKRVKQECTKGCGRTRLVVPSYANNYPNWTCKYCSSSPLGRLPTFESVLACVERRLAGATWATLSREENFDPKQLHNLQRALYIRLRNGDRSDLIAQLWPRSVPRWLSRYDNKRSKK